jgi:hypothetical protein
LPSGFSRVFRHLMRHCLLNDEARNGIAVLLKRWTPICITFGVLLADGEAYRSAWSVKGAQGKDVQLEVRQPLQRCRPRAQVSLCNGHRLRGCHKVQPACIHESPNVYVGCEADTCLRKRAVHHNTTAKWYKAQAVQGRNR